MPLIPPPLPEPLGVRDRTHPMAAAEAWRAFAWGARWPSCIRVGSGPLFPLPPFLPPLPWPLPKSSCFAAAAADDEAPEPARAAYGSAKGAMRWAAEPGSGHRLNGEMAARALGSAILVSSVAVVKPGPANKVEQSNDWQTAQAGENLDYPSALKSPPKTTTTVL